ncbi:glutathione-regulated potassium-efflux system protein KefC [Rivibacter subsaxonicus]|uniref:Glutathione-regulated potassium-efflux system ancillary protein KefC n=1 Tax=Rivibacter subsaxonicus TaxID=457575 RepID=A0A4Q7V767_9BURK|nr:glutathione-regulated potassium-efflux system protein KefC [Rivibacter subsaxonicus]RZT91290.1 glutathione-regulated potassium-efflux system ancillary protein KefC [Rivibacter subsaxonicus]
MHVTPWLLSTLVFLAAAVIVVPLARALGLGAIIGYLAAGLLIGPHGLKLVTDPETVLHFAEFGVVLMLFLVGLELVPSKLWELRRPIFGWGTLQMAGCTAAIAGVALAFGVPWKVALIAALGLALSSTAIALQVLAERNLMRTGSGETGFAILLFQDVAAIPILALIPLLGAVAADDGANPWWEAARAIGVIVAVIFGGRLLLRPLLRWIARSGTPELFTATALFLVVGVAALMQVAGLSMALGAFLGGVLLAESEYKRELETDLEPFKGLLLGLFFIAVGMSVDFDALARQPWTVLGVLLGFMALKLAVLAALAKAIGLPVAERPVFALLLAQGGEFAFVVFQGAVGARIFSADTASVLIGAVALSMLLTPLLLVAVDRFVAPLYARGATRKIDEIAEPQQAPIIILGFGRYGQIIGRMLYANGLSATVLDHDAEQVEGTRRFGWPVYYGDATRLDLLRTAGAAEARIIVVAIDDIEQSLKVVDIVQEHFAQALIVARARNVQHWYELRDRGVQHVERETLDAALMSARSVLELMGWQPHRARQLAMRFRRHNIEQIEELRPHRKDESKLINMSKQGRQQLEQLFAQEREQRKERREQGWGSDDAPARGPPP